MRIMPEEPGKAEEKREAWLKIELFTPTELSDALTNFLTEIGAQGAFQESPEPQSPHDFPGITLRETLMAFLPCDADLEQRLVGLRTYLDSVAEIFPELEKPGFRTEVVRDPNWGEAWKKYFKPLRVGRYFVIKPTWERFTQKRGDIVIEIDPGMAFGTGQHASTRMCLQAIESIFIEERTFEKSRVLDVGTGTGILGIACAKLGAELVLCVDNDPLATKIAQDNVLVNRVEDHVTVADCDIAALTEPFPLIVANLTAKILGELCPHLVRLVNPGGFLVIAGIIEQNRPDIEARFLGGSFTLHHLITEKEWVCYVLKKVSCRQ
jgi:ribosomal protein L11 methyltransferase